jgi:hypothetical protein
MGDLDQIGNVEQGAQTANADAGNAVESNEPSVVDQVRAMRESAQQEQSGQEVVAENPDDAQQEGNANADQSGESGDAPVGDLLSPQSVAAFIMGLDLQGKKGAVAQAPQAPAAVAANVPDFAAMRKQITDNFDADDFVAKQQLANLDISEQLWKQNQELSKVVDGYKQQSAQQDAKLVEQQRSQAVGWLANEGYAAVVGKPGQQTPAQKIAYDKIEMQAVALFNTLESIQPGRYKSAEVFKSVLAAQGHRPALPGTKLVPQAKQPQRAGVRSAARPDEPVKLDSHDAVVKAIGQMRRAQMA